MFCLKVALKNSTSVHFYTLKSRRAPMEQLCPHIKEEH
jgi:hypothetical protein